MIPVIPAISARVFRFRVSIADVSLHVVVVVLVLGDYPHRHPVQTFVDDVAPRESSNLSLDRHCALA